MSKNPAKDFGEIPTGVGLVATSARTNVLREFWIASFKLLGHEMPYNTSEDIEVALQALNVNYEKYEVPDELSFPRFGRKSDADHSLSPGRSPCKDAQSRPHRDPHRNRSLHAATVMNWEQSPD
jgi:hypothetical protein